MSNSFKIVMALAALSVTAACGNRTEEVVYTDPAPVIAPEPTYSKF